jgi:hypothetical protein
MDDRKLCDLESWGGYLTSRRTGEQSGLCSLALSDKGDPIQRQGNQSQDDKKVSASCVL